MKRIYIVLLAISLLCGLLTGCGEKTQATTAAVKSQPAAAQTAPAQQADSTASQPTAAPDPQPTDTPAQEEKTEEIVDLTQLSTTMIYSEVSNMVMNPKDYDGKTVKMKGQFAAYEGNPQNVDGPAYYFLVVIADATACCQQGLEFVLSEDATYPDDYPPEGTEITVTGTFHLYDNDGYENYNLENATMVIDE